jgi:hypothetical protein
MLAPGFSQARPRKMSSPGTFPGSPSVQRHTEDPAALSVSLHPFSCCLDLPTFPSTPLTSLGASWHVGSPVAYAGYFCLSGPGPDMEKTACKSDPTIALGVSSPSQEA